MEVLLQSFSVDILTAQYRVIGEIRTRGEPSVYFNNDSVSTLTVYDATLVPLHPNARIQPILVDEMHIPKSEPQVITLGSYTPQSPLLPKEIRMICFTDTYVIRGIFHTSQETQAADIFHVTPHPFFAVSYADIFTLHEMAVDVKARAELAYIRGDMIRAFYQDNPAK